MRAMEEFEDDVEFECGGEHYEAVCYDEHTGCAGCFLMPVLLFLIVFLCSALRL
jgi:hypothetical protein